MNMRDKPEPAAKKKRPVREPFSSQLEPGLRMRFRVAAVERGLTFCEALEMAIDGYIGDGR